VREDAMYVHIGEAIMLRTSDIIAIIDKNSFELPKKKQIAVEQAGASTNFLDNGYKSVIVTENKFYLSPFSSGTLKKRIFENYSQKPQI
jgi:predicted Ser/Thr protein kinase